MTDQRELRFVEWLQDGPSRGPADGLSDVFAVTRSTSQRPAWISRIASVPEGALVLGQSLPRSLAYVALVLLLLLALVFAFVVGAPRRLPPPLGPARNGALIYEHNGQVLLFDPVADSTRTLDGLQGANHSPRFSHDGSRFAFYNEPVPGLSQPANRLYVANDDLRNARDLSGGTDFVVCTCTSPEWSPDDTQIVFQARNSDQPKLYVVPVDGSAAPIAITDSSVARRMAQWSPDGEWLAFVRVVDGASSTAALGFARVDGSDERVYDTQSQAGDAGGFGGARWAPDSSRVAYVRGSEQQRYAAALVVATLEGEIDEITIEPSGWLSNPRWSPDGTEIAFLAGDRYTRLVVVAADRSGERTIKLPRDAVSDLADGDCSLEWSPDGVSLLVRCPDKTPFVVSATPPYKLEYLDIPSGPDTSVDWQRLPF